MLWGMMTAPMMATAGCSVLAVTLGTRRPARYMVTSMSI